MKQSAFKEVEKILAETGVSFEHMNDNGGGAPCDVAAFAENRIKEMRTAMKKPHVSSDRIAGLIRKADRHMPMRHNARSWAANVANYIDQNS